MIKFISFLDKNERIKRREGVGRATYRCICVECGRFLEFGESDINRSKTLPHLLCLCGNLIQLHSKYL